MLDKDTAEKVKTLRGGAMEEYFVTHLAKEQAVFMREVLKLPARPGSYPECTGRLALPFDNPGAPARCLLRKLLAEEGAELEAESLNGLTYEKLAAAATE